jgi:2-polyprenyl-3-methyl-5-hydroxy-6-metoxy-1,4-benzoquinol methylase
LLLRTGELSAIEQQLYALCKDRVERAQYPLPLHETTASESLGWRLIVHRYLVKPLYYVGSNLLIRRYVKRFAASLFSSQQGRRICDIACGYDDLALEVAMQMNADVLMNDTTSKAQFYHAKKRAYTKVVYTVQNAIDLVLKKPFDLLLCKNVIHHMETREEMHALLVSISKNAENVIIIDPCDPRSTFLGKFWNNYYSSFLLDQGHSFLRLDEFQKEVELVFKDQKVFFKRMWTVKGPFMIATIQRSADTEEVH